MLLYLSAMSQSRQDKAQEYLSKASELLEKESKDGRKMAGYINSPIAPDAQKVCNMTTDTSDKAIFLTVMGMKYPDDKSVYFELADKLNFQRLFPHLLIKSITTQ